MILSIASKTFAEQRMSEDRRSADVSRIKHQPHFNYPSYALPQGSSGPSGLRPGRIGKGKSQSRRNREGCAEHSLKSPPSYVTAGRRLSDFCFRSGAWLHWHCLFALSSSLSLSPAPLSTLSKSTSLGLKPSRSFHILSYELRESAQGESKLKHATTTTTHSIQYSATYWLEQPVYTITVRRTTVWRSEVFRHSKSHLSIHLLHQP